MLYRLLLILFCLPAATVAEIRVVDDAGREVVLANPAQRIVSLSPHITELLFAAGAGEQVVGVSAYSNYPPEAERLPQVSSGGGLDLERILSLKPDLVIAWQSGIPAAQLDHLQRLGLTVFYSEPADIEAIATSLERFGQLAGSLEIARRAASDFRQQVAALRQKYSGGSTVRVFYQIWQDPLMTVNGRHMISHWLTLCGGENIFATLPALSPVVDVEAVLAEDPDAIVAGWYPGKADTWKDYWLRWPALRAVRQGHLLTVAAETMDRQTPRAVQAARQLCRVLELVRKDSRVSGGFHRETKPEANANRSFFR